MIEISLKESAMMPSLHIPTMPELPAIPEIPMIPGLIAAAALLVLLICLVAGRAVARARRERRELAVTLLALRREIQSANAVNARIGKRLRKTERRFEELRDQVAQYEARGETRAYDQAINLVRQGGDASKLVSNFGLSRGEAELVSLVHGRRRRAG
jgi:hypothetical protein